MEAYKTKAKVKKNHKVHIDNVPFDDGQEVEVVISVSKKNEHDNELKDSLVGSVIKYDNPFEPAITTQDWELIK